MGKIKQVRKFYGRSGYVLGGKFKKKSTLKSRKKNMKKSSYVKTEKIPTKSVDYKAGYRYYLWKVGK